MTDLHAALAATTDIDAVHALLARAGEGLAALGFNNWVPAYPRARVEESVRQGVLYVVKEMVDGRRQMADAPVLATYTLRTAPPHPYEGITWGTRDANARYLGRLAVDPSQQGAGIGRWCLSHIAGYCTRQGDSAIRCDVLHTNQKLRRFYERAGYLARGEREHSGWRFSVYELMLAR